MRSLLERWTDEIEPPGGVDPREYLRRRLRLDQSVCLLIAYGDQFREQSVAPLDTLERGMTLLFHDLLPGVHVLPFFPYSSDDGFSVIGRAVERRLAPTAETESRAALRAEALVLAGNGINCEMEIAHACLSHLL